MAYKGKTVSQYIVSYTAEKLDRIEIRPPKGTKLRWQAVAEKENKSLQRFVIDCVEEKISGSNNK